MDWLQRLKKKKKKKDYRLKMEMCILNLINKRNKHVEDNKI